MADSLTYLVTGANRGIGRQLVADLVLRPDTTVVATVRDPDSGTSQSLSALPTAAGSRLVVVPLDATREEMAHETLPQRLQENKVERLDVVVANAAAPALGSVLQTKAASARHCLEVNSIGLLRLFQACWPLLENSDGSSGGKRLVLMTSSVASIQGLETEDFPLTAYGMSKAAANWLAKKISVEFRDKGLLVGIIHPGWVQTDMGQALADHVGAEKPPMTVEESARCVMDQVSRLSAETTGNLISFDGQQLPW
ncbi:hypothetical protein L249_3120 [Ophiocordyceps polyrhachis-furcata BCC 54312]|uniref:Uncharacterized protein n=1 Tax=Ophiocordyceps polyrhachis-furcata BCC 54312 TaxID=1330021 RepID=A0A367LPU3_9HYPO|nr:hypothetical protein L249_3120 [Ophiocordyceps polyrhachis-furcata BCC 54312]